MLYLSDSAPYRLELAALRSQTSQTHHSPKTGLAAFGMLFFSVFSRWMKPWSTVVGWFIDSPFA